MDNLKVIAQLETLKRIDKIEALMTGMEVIKNEARVLVPVDTGFLRDSIDLTEAGDNSVELVAEADYAEDVEFGTTKMQAQPYFRPAIENKSDEALKKMAENIDKQIEGLIK